MYRVGYTPRITNILFAALFISKFTQCVWRYLLLVEVKRTLDQLWWFPKTFVDVHEKWGLQLNMIVWWRQKFSINKVFVLIPLWVHNNSDSKVFNKQKTFNFSKAKAVNINSWILLWNFFTFLSLSLHSLLTINFF